MAIDDRGIFSLRKSVRCLNATLAMRIKRSDSCAASFDKNIGKYRENETFFFNLLHEDHQVWVDVSTGFFIKFRIVGKIN